MQASTSIIYFTKNLWPEFTFWQLLAGVLYYQRHYQSMDNVKKSLQQFSNFVDDDKIIGELRHLKTNEDSSSVVNTGTQRVVDFLRKYELRKHNQLLELSSLNLCSA